MQLESREHGKQEALQKQRQSALEKLQDSGTAIKAATAGTPPPPTIFLLYNFQKAARKFLLYLLLTLSLCMLDTCSVALTG